MSSVTLELLSGKLNIYASLGTIFVMYLFVKFMQGKIRLSRKTLTRSITVICIVGVACSAVLNVFIGMAIFGAVCVAVYWKIPRPLLPVGNKAVVITVCKEFIPLLRFTRGRIINVAFSGNFPMERTSSHAMSQYAIDGFTHSLRLEMKKWGVYVSLVQPPFSGTDMLSKTGLRSLQSQIFQEATIEQRELYGEAYLKHMMDAALAKPSPSVTTDDLILLSDAVTEALLSTEPKAKYRCGGLYNLFSVCSSILPQSVSDTFSKNLSPPIDVKVGVLSDTKKEK
ncbi:11-beta-hydroxysteroid dehydrogenase type 2-like [Saccoglossus kowalevskii]